MTYDPDRHHRRSIRLKGFDYSRTAVYFVTICVQNRECLFGNISQNHWQPFNKRLWQRNYYEHVVREDTALEKIQGYIQNNPLTWQLDSLHPDVESKY